MQFKNWLNMDEGRFRGPVGGAFGNDRRRMQQRGGTQTAPRPAPIPQPSNVTVQPGTRQQNRFQDREQRVDYGKSIEKKIFDSLVKCGLRLEPVTSSEDKYSKIDAYWVTPNGKKAVQIKYRDTGDDIGFEVMLDYYGGVVGCDMKGRAEFYAVLNRAGNTIVMVRVAEAKAIINQMVQDAENGGFDDRGTYHKGRAVLMIRPDPRTGIKKLMAYLPVSMLQQVIQPCQANVSF